MPIKNTETPDPKIGGGTNPSISIQKPSKEVRDTFKFIWGAF